jgi:hypothetical protein
MAERTARERETLIFSNREQAQQFQERLEGRVQREQQGGVDKRREVVADEIAAELEKVHDVPPALTQPWEHTAAEHEEVQQLVNVAFEKDLKAAISQARKSQHYPRNLDLLHDVLTGEMYSLLVSSRINRQPVIGGVLGAAIVVLLAMALLVLTFSAF